MFGCIQVYIHILYTYICSDAYKKLRISCYIIPNKGIPHDKPATLGLIYGIMALGLPHLSHFGPNHSSIHSKFCRVDDVATVPP